MIFPQGTISVDYGSDKEFNILSVPGYHIDDVVVDGASVGVVSAYTFKNVTESGHIINAKFVINTYTITPTSGANGSISPNAVVTTNYGTSSTFTFTPDKKYHVDSVLVDNVSVGAGTTYTFTNIAANHTIVVAFAHNKHRITATASGNGVIYPRGSLDIEEGLDQAFTLLAVTGSHIKDLTIDGTSVGALEGYSFSDIEQDHTINAVFESDTTTLTSDNTTPGSSPGGSSGSSDTSSSNYPYYGYSPGGLVVVGGSGTTTDNTSTSKEKETPQEERAPKPEVTKESFEVPQLKSSGAEHYSEPEGYYKLTSSQSLSPSLLKLLDDMTIERLKKTEFSVRPIELNDNSVSYSINRKIKGLSFDSNTGVLRWTPKKNQIGSFKIKFTARDKNRNESEEAITIKVVKARRLLP